MADNEMHPIKTAPKDRDIIVFDARQKKFRVVFWGQALEDGSGAWVYARALSLSDPENALAFVVSEPTHWMDLPRSPLAN